MANINVSLSEAKIGWIGTGIMGAPMAGHLVDAGYNVSVYSRTKSKAEKLIAKGCDWYDTPAAVTENCNIVFTIVGYPKDVEEVYFGEGGILKSLRRDSVVIDMTTTLPGLAVRIDESCRAIGAHSVDAPVSGGEVGAVNGALSVMIGGEKNVVEAVLPIMDNFSKNMVYQGEAGAGQHTKMCNQIVVGGTMIGVCESLIYGAKAGLDLTTVLSSISKGAAGCWSLDVLAPKVVAGDFEPGFMVEHFIKDLGIVLEEAENMNLNLPGTSLVKELYETVVEMGGATKGTQALYLALEKMAG
ncbi:MAG TPA: NAD(P)-dependent oxidoreductase [Bacteroides sp.]|nr:NAD(P)-dependent oxidoreductase [Bacteroides sp.]